MARDTRGVTMDGSDAQQVYLPLPKDRLQDYPILVRTHADPTLVMRAIEPVITAVDPGLAATASTLQAMLRRTDAFPHRQHVSGDRVQHQPLRAPAGLDGDLQHRQLRRRPSHARNRHPDGHRRSAASTSSRLMMRGSLRPVVAGLLARDCAGRRSVAPAARRALRPWRRRCRVLRWRVLAVPDHRAGRDAGCLHGARCASIHLSRSGISNPPAGIPSRRHGRRLPQMTVVGPRLFQSAPAPTSSRPLPHTTVLAQVCGSSHTAST